MRCRDFNLAGFAVASAPEGSNVENNFIAAFVHTPRMETYRSPVLSFLFVTIFFDRTNDRLIIALGSSTKNLETSKIYRRV